MRRGGLLALLAACAAQVGAQSCANGPRSGTDGNAAYGACNMKQSGETCVPECATGYTVSGSFTLSCDLNAQYDAAGATCSPGTCTNGPSQNGDPNADYTNACNTLKTGQTCTPVCDPAYSRQGSFTLLCDQGFYDAAGATCTPNKCTGGPVAGTADSRAGYASCNSLSSGQTCTPTCPTGYAPSGTLTLTCSTSNTYSSTGFTCNAGTCTGGPISNADANADYSTCNSKVSGDICEPGCATGFTRAGSFTLTCTSGRYSAAGATCQANQCKGGPASNTHPQADYTDCTNNFVSGQTCEPTCTAGTTLSGSFVLQCDASGRYDAAGAVCSASDCRNGPNTGADPNADYTSCNVQATGSTCSPTCATGYTPSGTFTLMCSNGFYSASGVTCDPAACNAGPLAGTNDANAAYTTCNARVTGSSCQPDCNNGYLPSTSFTLACDTMNNNYDASGSRCVPQACSGGPTNPVAGGDYTGCNVKVSGETCTPTCAEGYTVTGSFTLTCVTSRYDATGATCDANACTGGPLVAQPQATYGADCTGAMAKTGGLCSPTCAAGYSPSGTLTLTCDSNGKYDASSVTCTAASCKNGPNMAVVGGIMDSCNALVTGQQCTPACEEGYVASGAPISLVCDTMTNTYGIGMFACTANACTGGPIANQDGAADYAACNGANSGATCNPACNAGYTRFGSFTLRCSAANTYDAAGATCSANACNGGPSGATGDANMVYDACNSLQSGKMCTPVCKAGYTFMGAAITLVCDMAGTYDASAATCSENTCLMGPSANADPNADYSGCNMLKTGGTCTPVCAMGYTVMGSFTLTCAADQYDADGATCVPTACTGGPTAANQDAAADYTACTNMLKSGETCQPTCNMGFQNNGQFVLVCDGATMPAGQYDAIGPVCTDCYLGEVNGDPNADYSDCKTPHPNLKRNTDTCTVACAAGYTAMGNPLTLGCQDGGGNPQQWDAAGVTCQANACMTKSPMSHPKLLVGDCATGKSTGDPCMPTCDAGYTVAGSIASLLCDAAGVFDTTGVTCNANTCQLGPSAGADVNANYDACNSQVSGQTCMPTCATGYSLVGSFVLECTANQYSAAGASCAAQSCSGGPIVTTVDPNAQYTMCNMLTTGQLCEITCISGYTRSAAFPVTCVDTTYDASAGTCTPNTCTMGPSANADVRADYTECSKLSTGATCKPACEAGYSLVGEFVLSCVAEQYDAMGATCSADACNMGPNVGADARADYTGCNMLQSGGMCTPTCEAGFAPSGSFQLVCSSGFYDASAVTCIANPCSNGPSTAISVGADYTTCTGGVSGDTCMPVCATGYSNNGSITLVCDASGYDPAGSECIPNACSLGATAMTADPNADYSSCFSLTTGFTCTPTCNAGYTVAGNFTVMCDPNPGAFDATGANCTPNACNSGPKANADGNAFYATCNVLKSGEVCTPTCDVGYTVANNFNLVCDDAEQYDAAGATCEPNVCSGGPNMMVPDGVDISACNQLSTGATCTPTCEPGFVASSFMLLCDAMGMFDPTGVGCTTAPCTGGPNFGADPNADYTTCSQNFTGDMCSPTCNTGFQLVGSFELNCAGVTATYSAVGATCRPNAEYPCTNGPTNPSMYVVYDDCNMMYTQQTCTLRCEEGYTATAGMSFVLDCLTGNYTDNSGIVCSPNSCTKPINPTAYADYSPCNSLATGGTCTPKCVDGYTSTGGFPLMCNAAGEYMIVDTCAPNTCQNGPLAASPGVDYSACNVLKTGDVCAYECNPGYIPSAPTALLCTAANQYDASMLQCVPNKCTNGPSVNANGNVDYSSCNGLSSGDVCAPSCFTGTPQGSVTMVCMDDGTYDAAGASCRIFCGSAMDPCAAVSQCQLTSCVGDTCATTNKPDGTACNDALDGTVDDQCRSGECVGTNLCANVVCTVQSQCHIVGQCDPATGTCNNPTKPDGTVCDDGNLNTVVDTCTAGMCVGTDRCVGVTCAPVDQCHTAGVCNPATGLCSQPNAAAGTVCNDGKVNTANDQCEDGVCGGNIVCGSTVCPRPEQCHEYKCNGAACMHAVVADGTPCEDGIPETMGDTCQRGACVGTNKCLMPPCPDDQCKRLGWCDYSTGVWDILNLPDGTSCDDRNDDTLGDVCMAGVCKGTFKCSTACADAGQCFAQGVCDFNTGKCTSPLKPDYSACDDGNPTTTNDACLRGVCAGLIPCASDCRAIDQCHQATCDGSGCRQLQRPDGTPCDSGKGTLNDRCVAGVCVGDAACTGETCYPPTSCHTATCESNTECRIQIKPDFTMCDDNNPLTINDKCQFGVCCGEVPCAAGCPPESSCHLTGTCQPNGLCSSPVKMSGTPCDDGSVETINDVCNQGVCLGTATCSGSQSACPVAQCQIPACNGTSCTQLWAVDGASCNDANAATYRDTCCGGKCVGIDPCANVVCNPIDQCHDAGVCQNGVCTTPTAPEGRMCDDGLMSTAQDACRSGACVGVNRCAAVVCRAPDQCHFTGVCDPFSGLCVEQPRADGTSCDDGDPDTSGDVCMNGVCSGFVTCGSTLCTAGSCYNVMCVGSSCSQTIKPDGTPCNDNRAETNDDRCLAGVCMGTDKCEGVVCVAVGQCYDAGVCDPATGLCTAKMKPTYTECDDGNPLTIEDHCKSGVCRGRSRCDGVSCKASDQCHCPGVCDLATGMCTDPVKSDGSACSDGNVNTIDDRCVGGVCAISLSCGFETCTTSQACRVPVCDGSVCRQLIAPDGTACNDNNIETWEDKCMGGVCMGTHPCQGVVCPPISQCTRRSTCMPYTGKCSVVYQADETPCDDGDGTTVDDQCMEGVCMGRPRCSGVVCEARDGCYVSGVCDPQTGLCGETRRADGTACDDGLVTTTSDVCRNGICTGTLQCNGVTCPPPGPCTTISCNGTCVELTKTDGTACNDNDPATQNDVCMAGQCRGTNRCDGVTCTAISQCHNPGVCDVATGLCVYTKKADGTACDDGIPGSVDDKCMDGYCAGRDACANVVCTRTDQCHGVGVCEAGVCSDPVLPNNTPCDDGDSLTTSDLCFDGVCSGTIQCGIITCRALDATCYATQCQSGTCLQVPKPQGTACSDGSSSTTGDVCRMGECIGVGPCTGVDCTATNQCYMDGECNPTTGTCSTPVKPNGSPCDDGDVSTLSDTCVEGQCIGTTLTCATFTMCGNFDVIKTAPCPRSGCTAQVCCSTSNACTGVVCTSSDSCHSVGQCDPMTGLCSDPIVADGTVCSDGYDQTTGDVCKNGVCTGFLECATSTCSLDTGAACRLPTCIDNVCSDIEKPNGAPCNDGNVTTTNDVCNNGVCAGVNRCRSVVCTQSDQCHDVGRCSYSNGLCTDPAKLYGTPCNDGNSESVDDICIQGACVGVVRCGSVNCTSSRPQCYTAFCEDGKCGERPKPDGTVCNDGNSATDNDVCKSGQCVGIDKCYGVVCAPKNQCYNPGICSFGQCSDQLKLDGTPCDDGDETTTHDVCTLGTCKGLPRCDGVVCTQSDDCHTVGVCDEKTGLCTDPPVEDGTPCSDRNGFTANDKCVAGMCIGELMCDGGVTCISSEPCRRAECGAFGQCVTVPLADGTECNDMRPETHMDQCVMGECRGSSPCDTVVCNPLDDCHDTECDQATGKCVHPFKANYTLCNDGFQVTSNDVCMAGVCRGQINCQNVNCEPTTLQCVRTQCDVLSGQCLAVPLPDGGACTDGVASTTGDTCVNGLCRGSIPCGSASCVASSDCMTPSCIGGSCLQVPKQDGTMCYDKAAQLEGMCASGVCVAGEDACADVICYPESQCHREGVCRNGRCPSIPLPDGTSCDDGDAATGNDHCMAGVCVGQDLCKGVVCVKQATCRTVGTCDPRTGQCTNPIALDGTACTPENPNTFDARCQQGTCVGTTVCAGVSCPTPPQCYTAECSGTMCLELPSADGTPCYDGNDNTVDDKCQSGVCRGVDLCAGVTCPTTACNVGICNVGQCVYERIGNGGACDDGFERTVGDVCMDGVCRGKDLCADVTCTRSDQCHAVGECDPLTGFCTEPRVPDGTFCNDGNAATPVDVCTRGVCVSSVPCPTNCTSSEPCTTVTCTDGICRIIPLADGTTCTDENPMTVDDKCVRGECMGTNLCKDVKCDTPDQCYFPADCDPRSGQCMLRNKVDGTPCEDGNPDTVNDMCVAGLCMGSSPCSTTTCRSTACRMASCNGDNCEYTVSPVGTACDDGNPASFGDSCFDGMCYGTVTCGAVTCPNPKTCHVMQCILGSCTEVMQDDGMVCDDGNGATNGDICVAGKCVGQDLCAGVTCMAAGPCYRVGECNPRTGTCTTPLAPENSFCNDGNEATTDDRCVQGTCVGQDRCAHVECGSVDQCHTTPVCNPLTGVCETHPKRDRTACDDANPETPYEYCFEGYCRGQLQCAGSTCTSPEACKTVICSGTTCEYISVADGTPCWDGESSTAMDVCMGGVCVGYDLCASKTCSPISQCHLEGECLPNGECTTPVKPNESPCDDRNIETFPDVCLQGQCVGLSRCDGVICQPSDQCHFVGACNPTDGLCTDARKPQGTVCDDGRPDTLEDACIDNIGCSGYVACPSGQCFPSSPCHYPICNNSVCGELPKPNGSPCNDENNRTVDDTCQFGKCVGADPCAGVVCSAISECRNPGTCDAAKGICTNPSKPDGVVCSGGQGTCQEGVCVTVDRCDGVVCEPSDQCHNAGVCDPATGLCTDPVKADGLLCDNGDPNTEASCQNGVCVSSVPCGDTVCTSTNACSTVKCSGGKCLTLTKANGTECNDGNVLTVNDACFSGQCRGQDLCANVVCESTNPCLEKGVCEPKKGSCSFEAKADGTVCGVGLMCLAGVCGTQDICGGTACYPSSQCMETGPCRPEGGCSEVSKPDGSLCDDLRAETVGDQCLMGLCQGVVKCARPCAQPEECHRPGVCSPETGVCFFEPLPDGDLCDDRNPSTQSSKCIGGNCIGSTVCNGRICTSQDACHVAVCQADECVQTQKTDGTTCDDGLAETQNDRCAAGVCAGDVVCAGVVCGIIDACHGQGECDPLTGRCSAPLLPDGTQCGPDQTCQNGVCRALPLSTCQSFTSTTCLLHPSPQQVLCRDCDEVTCCQKCSTFNEALCPSGRLRVDHALVSCLADGCQAELCCAPDRCRGCTASDTCHDVGECNQDTGFCSDPIKRDLTSCDDGNPQTENDVCIEGVCTGTVVCAGMTCEPIDECYEPFCNSNICQQRAKYDGATCNDRNIFTVNDVCAAGVCQGRDKCAGVVCTRASQCHEVGQCDPLTGVCTEPPVSLGIPCDDGNSETINDQCVEGKCIGGVPCGRTLCKVQYPECQVPACIQGACISLQQTGDCNDGDPFTFGDVCINGVCRGTSLCEGVTCPAPDQCHAQAQCDPKTGVCMDTTLPDGTTCDDGSSLTPNDKCSAGACLSIEVCAGMICRPPQPMCQRAYCDGGVCRIEALTDGSRCNDNDETTVDDTCRRGDCVGVDLCRNVVCNAPDTCHQPGTCNPMTGLCRFPIAADGIRCNDGDPSTTNDRCRGGHCSGSITCDGFTQCVAAGSCRMAKCVAGACIQDAAADGTKCDDEKPHTVNDRCEMGMCVGDDVCEDVVCVPKNQCHEVGVCRGGTCSEPVLADGTDCNDGNPLTAIDRCVAGVCVGMDVCGGKPCHPQNVQCSTAMCSSDGLTCIEETLPDGTPCNDGNVQTKEDQCSSGQCRGVNLCTNVMCQPTDTCHRSSCSPTSGKCVEEVTPEWTRCNDGNPATVDDACRAGVCVGRLPCGDTFCDNHDPVCNTVMCRDDRCVTMASPDGTPCNDNNPETANDQCNGGLCAGIDLCLNVLCAAPAGSCDVSRGCHSGTGECMYTDGAYGAPCSDSRPETINDICIDGQCIGTLQCGTTFCAPSDDDVCTRHECQNDVCVKVDSPAGTPCDDENPRTTKDVCKDGVCAGRDLCAGVKCQDSECTTAQCDPMTGLCADKPKANGTACYGGAEGLDSVCRGGVCVAAVLCGEQVCTAGDHAAAACRYPVCNSSLPLIGAVCDVRAKPDGTPCSDGNDATSNDACKSGECVGLDKCEGVVCRDQTCYEPSMCDPRTGLCTEDPLVDGTECDDRDPATQDDVCMNGVCRGKSMCSQECAPAGTCFDATCEGGTTCVQTARIEGAQCDDNDPSTYDDRCREGACAGMNRCKDVQCLSDSECTLDSTCNPNTGACYDPPIVPDGTECSTGVCARGVCVAKVQCGGVTCPTPTAVCRVASCVAGSCEEVSAPNFSDCNDDNPDTMYDQCLDGMCAGQDLCASTTCRPDNACREVGICNPATGLCSSPPKTDGTACNDGNPDTAQESCIGGRCVGVVDCGGKDCFARTECAVAVCENDECIIKTSVDGVACNDNDDATFNDICLNGVCVGTDLCDNVFCPTKECKKRSSCDRRTGLCMELNLADGTECSDGNAETVDDVCLNGLCAGYESCGEVRCERTPQCHEMTCDGEGNTCLPKPLAQGYVCDDGNAKTENDQCDGLGNCKGTDPCGGVSCQADDPNGCQQTGICVPATGSCAMVPEEPGARCEVGDVTGQCAGFVCMVTLVCDGQTCPPHDAQCSYPSCDPGCTTTPVADGTVCSLGECRDGVCLATSQCRDKVCTDTECVKDARCDIATGQCTGRTLPDGTVCNDADVLTSVDRCEAAKCVGRVNCGGEACFADECQYAICTAENRCGLNDRYDGTYCTRVDGGECRSGRCEVAPLCAGVVCNSGNKCVESRCDPGSGKCVETPLNDVPCDDGSIDTVYDTCIMGVCQRQLVCRGRLCTPQSNCMSVSCNGEQCVQRQKPDGVECNDGDQSTLNDRCVDGVCVGVKDPLCEGVTCAARSQCHVAGVCVAGTCTQPHAADGLQCADGDATTPDDLCFAGRCVGVIRCGDQVCLPEGPGCTKAQCDNGRCISVPQGDGAACGTGGVCRAGECVGELVTPSPPPTPTSNDCAGLGRVCATGSQECVAPDPARPQLWQCRCLSGNQGVEAGRVATCTPAVTDSAGAIEVELTADVGALQWKDKLAAILGVSPTRLEVNVDGRVVSVGMYGTPADGAQYSNPQPNDLITADALMKLFQSKVLECNTNRTDFCNDLTIQGVQVKSTQPDGTEVDQCDRLLVEGLCGEGCNWNKESGTCSSAAAADTDDDDAADMWKWLGPLLALLILSLIAAAVLLLCRKKPDPAAKKDPNGTPEEELLDKTVAAPPMDSPPVPPMEAIEDAPYQPAPSFMPVDSTPNGFVDLAGEGSRYQNPDGPSPVNRTPSQIYSGMRHDISQPPLGDDVPAPMGRGQPLGPPQNFFSPDEPVGSAYSPYAPRSDASPGRQRSVIGGGGGGSNLPPLLPSFSGTPYLSSPNPNRLSQAPAAHMSQQLAAPNPASPYSDTGSQKAFYI